MVENSAEKFLRIAEYCEIKARGAGLPVDEDAWLTLASDFRALSQEMNEWPKKVESRIKNEAHELPRPD